MAVKKPVTAKSTVSAQRRDMKAKAAASKQSAAGEEVVTIDRRSKSPRRTDAEVEAADAPQLERRKKVQRRRQIDPTTCERDYSIEEVEFMNAMDEYKRTSGRMFPTCSEVLEVIRSLGYVRLSPAGRAVLAGEMDLSGDSQPLAGEELEVQELMF